MNYGWAALENFIPKPVEPAPVCCVCSCSVPDLPMSAVEAGFKPVCSDRCEAARCADRERKRR